MAYQSLCEFQLYEDANWDGFGDDLGTIALYDGEN